MKTYPVPLKYEDEVDKEIQNMLKVGLVSRSNSNYINQVLIVPKKNGKFEFAYIAGK